MPGTRRVRTVKPTSVKKDEAIIGTNDYSIVSKRSVEKLYYSREPQFLKPCVSKFKRRAPLINRGYWLRMRAIDQAVQDFLQEPFERPKIIVNLGCGYDPLPFQSLFRYPGHEVRYVDVDYPQCIEKKVEMIRGEELYTSVIGTEYTVEPPFRKSETPNNHLRTHVDASSTHPVRNEDVRSDQAVDVPLSSATGKPNKTTIKKPEVSNCSTYFTRERYVAIGCDLRQLAALKEALIREVDILNCAVLFVAEVSITYMDVEAADAVIRWAAEFDNSHFCLLEQYLPDGPHHPFARTMIEHFGKQTPIRPIYRYPLLADQRLRFQHRGWSTAAVQSLWNFWNDGLDTKERSSLDAAEPFDEWEEFAMFAGHYFVLQARNSPAADPVGGTDISVSSAEIAPITCQTGTLVTRRNLQGLGLRRFGAVMSGADCVTHHGGLNGQSRHSGRDAYTKFQITPIDAPKEAPAELMCHTITQLHEKDMYLLVGGRTSPSKASSSCWHYQDKVWNRVHDLEPGRYRHCAVSVPKGVLVFGGKTGSGTVLDEWMHWDPIAGWQAVEVPATRPAARFGASLAVVEGGGNTGVVLGGMTQDGIVLKDFWKWTLTNKASGIQLVFEDLTEKVQRSCPSGAYARFGASLMLSRWGLLLIGGVSSGGVLRQEDEMFALSPNGNIAGFEILNLSKDDRPLLVGFGAAAVDGGNIFFFGGGAVCFSFGAFWNDSCYLLCNSSDVSPAMWHLVSDTVSTDEQTAEVSKHAAGLAPAPPSGSTCFLNTTVAKAADQKNIQSIPRTQVTTTEEMDALIKTAQPAIIEDLDLGTCTTAWTPDYLKHQIGADRPVIAHSSLTKHMDFQAKNFSYTTQPFSAFLDSALSGGGHLYLRALSSQQPSKDPANLCRDFPTIALDFHLPGPLSMVTNNEHSSVLRISGDVDMWLHYDVMANVYCQIRGRKRLVLFPPSDVRALGFPAGSTTSNLNVFSGDGAALARTHPREALLEPGDVLFIPSCWPHAATPVGDEGSVAVNVFFRDLESGYAAGKDVYGNRDLEAYQNGRRDVERICKMVAVVPSEEAQAALERCARALLEKGELEGQERGAKEVRRMVKSVEGLPEDVGRFYLDRLAGELFEKVGLS